MILDEVGDRQASGKTAAMQAEVENVRRCFWSAWMMNCVVADHYITGSSADGHALALSLPMLESSYQNSIHDDRSTLAAAMTNFPSREKVEVPSIMAEMMKMIWFWIRVQDYIATRKFSPTADFLKLLFSLDDDLRQWNSQCHLTFTYSKHNLYKELGLKHQQGFVAVHALYHQCRMILHASLVPRLSGIVPEVEIPEELLKTSTEIVTTSARALSDLAADILNLRHDVAQLAPFVGYCMYVAAFIHMRLARSPNGLQARQDLRSSLRLLKAMKPYWKWIRLSRLHEGGTGSESATNTMAPPSRRANQLEVELNGPSDSSRFSDGLTKLDGFPVLRYSLDCAQDPHYARHNSSTAVRLEALIESGQDGMQEQRNGPPSYDSNACWSADKLVDNSIENFVPTSILDTEYSPFPPVGEGTIDFSDVDEYLRLAVSSFTDTDWWQIGQESASHTI
nr:hypothetical protein CFP56_22175 [Quercus suber]